jgi:long-chain acyl-CoA synthetase
MHTPWLAHYEPGVPQTLKYPALPLHGLLEQTAARYPERIATIFFGAQLTYRALNAAADRFAYALLSFGLKRGDRVALMLPNCPQFLIAFYGTLKAGGVVTAVNPLYTPRELEHQLNDAEVETLVTLTKFYPTVEAIRAKTALQRVIVTNIKESFPAALRLLFTLFKERKEGHRVSLRRATAAYWFRDVLSAQSTASAPGIAVDPDDTALLQYTGGTTGTPKGAMLKHAGLVANTLQIRAWLSDFQEAGETMLLVLPLFHVFGMGVCMSVMVHGAGTMILLPQFRTHDVLQAIARIGTRQPHIPAPLFQRRGAIAAGGTAAFRSAHRRAPRRGLRHDRSERLHHYPLTWRAQTREHWHPDPGRRGQNRGSRDRHADSTTGRSRRARRQM